MREHLLMRECRHPNIVLFLGLAREPGDFGRTFVSPFCRVPSHFRSRELIGVSHCGDGRFAPSTSRQAT